jgi:hypothetical protein
MLRELCSNYELHLRNHFKVPKMKTIRHFIWAYIYSLLKATSHFLPVKLTHDSPLVTSGSFVNHMTQSIKTGNVKLNLNNGLRRTWNWSQPCWSSAPETYTEVGTCGHRVPHIVEMEPKNLQRICQETTTCTTKLSASISHTTDFRTGDPPPPQVTTIRRYSAKYSINYINSNTWIQNHSFWHFQVD